MRTAVKLLIAFCAWLGIFEPHLIEPLQVLPATTVAGALNLGDWILLALMYGAVSVIDTVTTLVVQRGGLVTNLRRRR